MAKAPKKAPKKQEDKFKKGDKVFWIVKVNGILRKYSGVVIAKVNRKLDAQKVARKINKKLHVSTVLDATARLRSQRNADSYIVKTINANGEPVLHWPFTHKLRLAI